MQGFVEHLEMDSEAPAQTEGGYPLTLFDSIHYKHTVQTKLIVSIVLLFIVE